MCIHLPGKCNQWIYLSTYLCAYIYIYISYIYIYQKIIFSSGTHMVQIHGLNACTILSIFRARYLDERTFRFIFKHRISYLYKHSITAMHWKHEVAFTLPTVVTTCYGEVFVKSQPAKPTTSSRCFIIPGLQMLLTQSFSVFLECEMVHVN